ncbi:uncharacterized protein BJ171DRAFT_490106 [Polychytrium aggregatum]|uniref:uncharacterized protein n=1 Tax=Polychytrium aggregatum TaxID=110093 RepID=UPI0022FF4136|nr:uncharacterized protein BJ171DRAFT_490106 [Polychytrium aggregatum]KAI9208055.1 hypothetical protein BJ171DRAFT_490106 [Polychytrium aggregatum]
MASMRDAMKRLQIIYEACAPEAIEEAAIENAMDEFSKMRKKIHKGVKEVRVALKERESLMAQSGGTSNEVAEASYRIRVMIRNLKEDSTKLQNIAAKDEKKKRIKDQEQLQERKEIVTLCQQHIEECENLEKKRFNEGHGVERVALLTSNNKAKPEDDSRAQLFAKKGGEPDPYLDSELNDIDVDEDMQKIKEKNKAIDTDLEGISVGVGKLKQIALDMDQELTNQNEKLDEVDKKVENALDHVDNLNIKMKKSLEGVMKGDRFMVNCVLLCILLAIVAFISSIFSTSK